MRAGAGTNFAEVGRIPPGGEFLVLEGPECNQNFAWFRVDYDGLIGWTAEGEAVRYWLEVINPDGEVPTATPGAAECIATADGVINLRRGPGTNFNAAGQSAPGQQFVVVGFAENASGFTWYQFDNEFWGREDVVDLRGDCTGLPRVR